MRLVHHLVIMAAILGALGASVAYAQQDVDFLFTVVDANHDNAIDRQEIVAFAVMQWKSLDPRDSGSVARDTLLANPGAMAPVQDLMPRPDSTLSRQSFISGYEKRFDESDLDHNGTLDIDEYAGFIGAPPREAMTGPIMQLPTLATSYAAGLPACADLGRNPAYGLAENQGISSLSAKIVPANNKDAAYCQVQFVYNSGRAGLQDGYEEGKQQAITIRVGLPLRPNDGGKVDWNGRIQNVGSGGCMGNLPNVTIATNAGFASASSDGGHGAPWLLFNCTFGVDQAKHELNRGLITDFSAQHVKWQTVWSKTLVKTYYGQPAQRTYWCGCSQGGREGFIALQTMPQEYDGILVGGSALYWMRFQLAQGWSGLVIKDMLRTKGKDLTMAQIDRTVQLEAAACDAVDGLKDDSVADPRQCHWSAKAAICGSVGAAESNLCLDKDQAEAFDAIRRGPRNHLGQLIWFTYEPGTTYSNQTDYWLSDGMMQWSVRDLNFKSIDHLYMDKKHLLAAKDPKGITYEDMATLASQVGSDLADTDDTALDAARASGVKVIAWTGTADKNIQPRATIKYYRDVAAHFRMKVSDQGLQSWYRTFLYPDHAHCGGGKGPQAGSVYNGPLFESLIAWVESKQAPDRILATKRDERGNILRTRPVCPYPQSATYIGTGSINDAANFVCKGNLETAKIVAADELAPHKKENGTGIIPANYREDRK